MILFVTVLLFLSKGYSQVFIPFGFWGCKSATPYSDTSNIQFSSGSFSNTSWDGTKIVLNAGQTTGDFTSRVINTQSPCAQLYQKMIWQTSLPFGKEISPSIESGYTMIPTDFSTSLVGYWKLNELSASSGSSNDFTDSSGNGNHGEGSGAITYATVGKLNYSISKSGTSADYIEISDSDTLDNSSRMSFSFWIYPTVLDGQPRGIVTKRVNSGSNLSYGFFMYTGNRLNIDIDGSGNRFATTTVFSTNQWYHIAVVYDGTLAAGSRSKVYINGSLDITASETSLTIPNYASTLMIGHMQAQSQSFVGKIDDVAIWKDRALTAAEVLEIYKRAALKIKIQIRTCTLSDCSDNPTWLGPDGTNSTYFTEINNNSIPSTGLGVVSTTAPEMVLSHFPFLIIMSYSYFQYRVVFETDHSSYSPDLNLLSIYR